MQPSIGQSGWPVDEYCERNLGRRTKIIHGQRVATH